MLMWGYCRACFYQLPIGSYPLDHFKSYERSRTELDFIKITLSPAHCLFTVCKVLQWLPKRLCIDKIVMWARVLTYNIPQPIYSRKYTLVRVLCDLDIAASCQLNCRLRNCISSITLDVVFAHLCVFSLVSRRWRSARQAISGSGSEWKLVFAFMRKICFYGHVFS